MADTDKKCTIGVNVSLTNKNGKLTVGEAKLTNPDEITKCMKTGEAATVSAPAASVTTDKAQANQESDGTSASSSVQIGKGRKKSRGRGKRGGRKSKRRSSKKARKSRKSKRRRGKKSKRRRRK